MLLILSDNSFDNEFIANSSIAEILAHIHIKQEVIIIPKLKYNSGKQNNTCPIILYVSSVTYIYYTKRQKNIF